MRLERLQIRNLATIEKVAVEFSCGLHVLTGETGAGKSVVVDALSLLAGGRATANLVRRKAESLVVEGVFGKPSPALLQKLREAGVEDEGLIIRRTVAPGAANRIYINDSPVSLKFLASIIDSQITIHGQADQLALMTAPVRRRYLDRFAGLDKKVEKLNRLADSIRMKEQEREALKEQMERAMEKREMIRRQRDDIAALNLEEGEEERLTVQRRIARNREALIHAFEAADHLLNDDAKGLLPSLITLRSHLDLIVESFPDLRVSAREVDGMTAGLSDLNATIEELSGETAQPSTSLEALETRLAQIEAIKRRFGPTERDVLNALEHFEKDLGTLTVGDEALKTLEKEIVEAHRAYAPLAQALTDQRRKAAASLSKAVSRRLGRLAMKDATFRVALTPLGAEPKRGGNDRVDFMVALNPGEGEHPLEASASGGELSRIQLALMTELTSQKDRIYVFDEVDQGIGGKAALEVGKMLRQLAAENQVFVVTHLPQVAAHAHHHIEVVKRVASGRTRTTLKILNEEERIDLLARMLSGNKNSRTARDHAWELFRSCQAV